MGIEQAGPGTKRNYTAALKAESDRLAFRIAVLNEEMMRLPLSKRRQRWQEYYRDLDWLMKRQEEIAKAVDVFTPNVQQRS